MNTEKLFARAVAALPQAVRQRLDAGTPLDWSVLEDPGTGVRLAEAARAHGRLPEAVEELVNRLLGDVGIVPADLAEGSERQRDPAAWIVRAAVEAEGESYRIRNIHSGEVHAGVRPEAVAGYAMLALEIAAAVHEAAERWNEAGERHAEAAGGASSLLGLCAVRMRERLRSPSGADAQRRTTAGLAGVLERAWNTQDLKTRAALSAVRLHGGLGTRGIHGTRGIRGMRGIRSTRGMHGAQAPGRSYYAPMTSYRLRSFDLGEILWLRALAEQAVEAASTESGEEDSGRPSPPAVLPPSVVPPAASPPKPAATEVSDANDISALEARIRAANEGTGRLLQLGSPPLDELAPDRELSGLREAAGGLPEGVRRRMRETYGIGFAHALSRLRSADDAEAVRAELERALARRGVPRWLEELAAALLADAGAQTREGTRTTGIRLHPEEETDAGYRAIEVEGGAAGRLTALGLVEQVRLGLVFATVAWRGHSAMRSAGREGGWTLDKGEAEGSAFSQEERETLEAARRMEQALDRIQRGRGFDAPTALEEASMTADTFRGIGTATRAAAGWPGGAEVPDSRAPGDVERIAIVSEALHERIRSIANRHIASWIAGNGDSGVASKGRPAMPGQDEARTTA
ncbi:MAG: hypothetical protein OXI20_22595 [Rhodospirillales bacterium]|nr:hypothetical protein [Rhodospirillales bacterium]